jgi:glycosyltransferase involved in cell wall biosynthesis
MAGWVPGATWHALKAVRRHRPDVLYSTFSPGSAHLVALIVNRATGIPWVADFRDAWTWNPQREQLARPFAWLSARLERAVVGSADYLVIVDESVELLEVDRDDRRLVVIRNGVDPDDVVPVDGRASGDRFRISYVGTLYGARNGAAVFAALRRLLDRGVIDERLLDVRIVGPASLEPDANLERLPVSRRGYVDHATAISEMAGADVLLFYAPKEVQGPSGKIYEYLVTGRPILCVAGSDNFAYQLVEELGAGRCAQPDDPRAIEDAIEHMYLRWKAGTLDVGPEVRAETLRRFSRQALARALADVLDAAAAKREPQPPSGLLRGMSKSHTRQMMFRRPRAARDRKSRSAP